MYIWHVYIFIYFLLDFNPQFNSMHINIQYISISIIGHIQKVRYIPSQCRAPLGPCAPEKATIIKLRGSDCNQP